MKQTSEAQPSIRWVIMGVSGCGKSTVGQHLADACGHAFVEGDAFHPQANVDKMSAGQPLAPVVVVERLGAIQAQLKRAREQGCGLVVSCSALKRSYRDLLREADPGLRFVHLDGPRLLIAERLAARRNHYMPPQLLDSQLAVLEPLGGEEHGLRLDIRQSPAQLVQAILGAAG